MDQKDLKGKVAIVTGSATGIGAAVAIALARRGANVVINYSKSEKEARETAEEIKALGSDVRVVKGDVSQDTDCRNLAQTALDAWKRIDILVNNAGTTKFVAHHDLEGLTADDFANIYAVNVIGAFQMVRACAASMKANGDGSVVNISSIAGLKGVGSSVAYAASKGALNTMTLSLARALAPEIRVNAVCPGYVATGWFKNRFGDEAFKRITDTQAETSPLKRAADGEEIAKTVLFFAGPESRHISGETLMTDGGLHLTLGVPAR
jgi:3-oxoacyl-[acyl-carrier protein] reductase